MRASRCLLVLIIPLALTREVASQSSAGSPPSTNAEIVRSVLDPLEKRILDVAEAMPAEKYSFAPTAGEFTGVRAFGEQLKHIAADLYLDAGMILGEQGVGDVGLSEAGAFAVRTKPEIIAYLRDAFAYMRRASATIDDANEPNPGENSRPYGPLRSARLRIATDRSARSGRRIGHVRASDRSHDVGSRMKGFQVRKLDSAVSPP